jgi:polar amino acid transport system substrate-binding protein
VGARFCAVAALSLLALALPNGRAWSQEKAPAAPVLKEVVVGTKEAPPFAMKSADGVWTGVSIELWNRIAEKLGYRTSFHEYKTVPEMLAAVSDGGVNASISAITVTSEREKSVDFTQPFFDSGLGVAVPLHKEIEWLGILGNVFTWRFLQAVGVLIAAALSVGFLIWLLERAQTEHYADTKGLGTGLWWSAAAMTQAAGADQAPRTLWGRALGMAWMIASVITIASLTAGLTAQLATKRLTSVVRSPGDLASVRTGSVSDTSAFDYLRREHVDARSFPDVASGLQALKAGKLDAFVYDRPILAWNVHGSFADDVEVLDQVFARENYAIALPIGSPLRGDINVAMVDELRGPWWGEVRIRYFGRE